MYKLLIVEDERWEREGLVDFLDWEAMGIEIAGAARDGIEGLELALELDPDIIITDIRMPGMDGLELSRRLKEIKPHIRIIILTGYGDFEYARKAIELSASQYVLKPVNETKLTDAIGKVLAECERDTVSRQEREALRAEVDRHRELMRGKWTEDLLSGSLDSKYVKELARSAGFKSDQGSFAAIAVKHAQDGRYGERLKELIQGPHIIAYSDKGQGQWFLVVSVPDDADDYAARIAERISHNNGMLWPSKITAAAGDAVHGLIQAGDSVKQAEGLLQYAVFWGESGAVSQEQAERERSSFMNAAPEFLHRGGQQFKAVIYSVNALDEEQALAGANGLFDDLEAQKGADGDFIRHYVSGLLFELSVLAGIHQENAGGAAEPGEQLNALYTIASVRAYTLQFIAASIAALREKRGGKEEYIVRQVNKLIEQKYSSPDISLKSIADEVFLSPNYLGSLYKKASGKAFHDQLSQVRMNKAKELLALPNYKVAKVAQEVGIPNTSYFCTVFKNTFGISPGEYQETIHRK